MKKRQLKKILVSRPRQNRKRNLRTLRQYVHNIINPFLLQYDIEQKGKHD